MAEISFRKSICLSGGSRLQTRTAKPEKSKMPPCGGGGTIDISPMPVNETPQKSGIFGMSGDIGGLRGTIGEMERAEVASWGKLGNRFPMIPPTLVTESASH